MTRIASTSLYLQLASFPGCIKRIQLGITLCRYFHLYPTAWQFKSGMHVDKPFMPLGIYLDRPKAIYVQHFTVTRKSIKASIAYKLVKLITRIFIQWWFSVTHTHSPVKHKQEQLCCQHLAISSHHFDSYHIHTREFLQPLNFKWPEITWISIWRI